MRMRSIASIALLLLAAALSFSPAAPGPSGPVLIRPGQQAPPSVAPAPPSVADQIGAVADSLNFLAITQSAGGGVSGSLGRTCEEARERMRWDGLPCAPEHLGPPSN
jgi:hypothetical protein